MSHLLTKPCLFFCSRLWVEFLKEAADAGEAAGQQEEWFGCRVVDRLLAIEIPQAQSGRKGGADKRAIRRGRLKDRGLLKSWREWYVVTRVEAGGMILTLQVLLGDLDIKQSHVRVVMAQQFHQCRQTHTCPQHRCRIGMPELVGNDVSFDPNPRGGVAQSFA